ncbi:GH14988 [Drosophila grimshawi]|uniref:GH14988 n=1 Tax=Drosophila grimshawi TaxID=7222 RepID=B4J0Z8_DROGR|nr:GH14988 [Drosophila grimshawi]
MGNRLSGLWCKKTTTLHINSDPKQPQQQQQQQQQEKLNENSICNNNKSNRKKSVGAASGAGGAGGGCGSFGGTFRFGSARRLSLTSCASKDRNTANKTSNCPISTIEAQYQDLVKTKAAAQQSRDEKANMKHDNTQLPTVKNVPRPASLGSQAGAAVDVNGERRCLCAREFLKPLLESGGDS